MLHLKKNINVRKNVTFLIVKKYSRCHLLTLSTEANLKCPVHFSWITRLLQFSSSSITGKKNLTIDCTCALYGRNIFSIHNFQWQPSIVYVYYQPFFSWGGVCPAENWAGGVCILQIKVHLKLKSQTMWNFSLSDECKEIIRKAKKTCKLRWNLLVTCQNIKLFNTHEVHGGFESYRSIHIKGQDFSFEI